MSENEKADMRLLKCNTEKDIHGRLNYRTAGKLVQRWTIANAYSWFRNFGGNLAVWNNNYAGGALWSRIQNTSLWTSSLFLS